MARVKESAIAAAEENEIDAVYGEVEETEEVEEVEVNESTVEITNGKPEELETRWHSESTCLAFTEIWSTDGQRWNLTLREGVTSKHLDKLFLAMEWTGKIAGKHGFEFRGAKAAPKNVDAFNSAVDSNDPLSPPPIGQKMTAAVKQQGAQQNSASSNGRPEYEQITRLVILPASGGDRSKPRVEFWGNPGLKYAIVTVPSWLVVNTLKRRYGYEDDGLTWLNEIGQSWTVDWSIKLVDSDKLNSRGNPYRNLGDIIDNKVAAE